MSEDPIDTVDHSSIPGYSTAKPPRAVMQIAPEQGQFLKLLIQLTAARRVLEIGVFTGYSSYWREAGVLDRIDLQLGPALATLQKLNDGRETGSFDLIFIDADKTNYCKYLEQSLLLVRAGGLIVV